MNELFVLLDMTSRLKELQRTGWINHYLSGILETTVAHTFSVMLLAWWFSEKTTINTEKMIKMALVHDLLECITGISLHRV